MALARMEISLSTIERNARIVREWLPPDTALCGVVKADAYGHGLAETAAAMSSGGADYVGVAREEEGAILRETGFRGRIVVLGPTEDADIAVSHDLEQMAFLPEHIAALSTAALRRGRQARVHLKIDTGMNRLGASAQRQVQALARALSHAPGVKAVAAFSHLASADDPSPEPLLRQLAKFHELTASLDEAGIAPLRHIANSAAMLREPNALLGMVRTGLALYGCAPAPFLPLLPGMRPAMRWVAPVERAQWVPAGEGIGYGARYVTRRDTLLVTLGVGYGDGYHRVMNRGCVLIHGKRAPILGSVCMDHLMVDATEIGHPGSEAVLLGEQDGATLSPDEVAEAWGTIPYEVMLARLPRVERVFAGA